MSTTIRGGRVRDKEKILENAKQFYGWHTGQRKKELPGLFSGRATWMRVIDADGHVEENPATFRCLSGARCAEFMSRRHRQLADDRRAALSAGLGGCLTRTPTLRKPTRHAAQKADASKAWAKDIRSAANHDEEGIDAQVIYPTLSPIL
jgi:hypothetical protein